MQLVRHVWVFALIQATAGGFSISGQNSPPVLTLNRNWKIPENEVVGIRIETARAQDAEDNALTFDIKPSAFIDGSRFFRIDPQLGDIYLNSSLEGEAGAQYYLFVTAKDGEFEVKTEVFVEVLSPTSSLSSSSGDKRRLSTSRPLTVPPIVTTPIAERPHFVRPSGPEEKDTVDHEVFNVINTGHRSVSDSNDGNASSGNGSVLRSEVSLDMASKDGDAGKDGTAYHATRVVIVAALTVAIPLAAVGFWFVRQSRRKKSDVIMDFKKRVDSNGTSTSLASARTPNLQESELVASSVQRAQSNKYETTEWEAAEVNKNRDSSSENAENGLVTTGGDHWEYPRNRLKIFGILGEGCFGQVWKCEVHNIAGLPGSTIVAVKTLKENAGEREKKDLVSELEVMKMLDPHPNIVRLLGSCAEKDPLFVIMEYVPHGKLQTYLRNSRAEHYYGNLHGSSQHLTSSDLTTFAHHVARGMEYLASKGIIHRDLAARNVLVGNNKTCKVADFGFARDVIANKIYERKSEGRLPIRWMAPESLYDNVFSSKTDVWSFGVLLWEIVTLGSTPYPGMAASDVIKKVRDGYRLEKPDHCKRELYNIMYYCWDKDSKERPSFTELAQTLENLLLNDVDYIELERFPEHAYYNVVSLSGEKL